MRAILALMLALLVGACGPGDTSSIDASDESSQGRLIVRRSQPDGPIAVEGSVSFARVETEDGTVVAEEGFDAPDHGTGAGTYDYPRELDIELEPGSYTLVSYQRACDPSCDNLDPQDGKYACRHPFEIEEGTMVAEVLVRAKDCEIQMSAVSP